jgi:hypothetical protein
MALSIAEANTVSKNYFDKTLTQQIYERSAFVARLKEKENIVCDGGVQIQWPIRHSKLNATNSVTPRSQIAYSQKETRTAAVLDWTYYVGQAMISWDERVKNVGQGQIINLIKDKTEELAQDMFDYFTTDVFATSAVTTKIAPLPVIVSASTYGGIAVADAAEWTAGLADTTTTRLVLYGSSTCLAKAINSSTFSPDGPDIIITTRDLFNKLESLIEPQTMRSDDGLQNAGFTNIKFHGVPVVGDAKMTAAMMLGLDTSAIELRYHPDFNWKVDDWSDLKQAGFPNALVKTVCWVGNLVCKRRKTNFKFTVLDYTL